jgi:hypothetical protein
MVGKREPRLPPLNPLRSKLSSIEIEAFVDWIICAASCAVSCAASRSVIDPSRTVIARIAGRPPIKRSPTPARENAAIWKAQVL